MLVKSISCNLVDNFGRVFNRTTNYGKYKNYHIAIESDRYKGKNVLQKTFVIWNDNMQKIVNKCRKENEKFERIG